MQYVAVATLQIWHTVYSQKQSFCIINTQFIYTWLRNYTHKNKHVQILFGYGLS